MFSKISQWIMALWGWKFTGQYPRHLAKVVIAVGPHTSNWDFPVGVMTNSGMKLNANYLGKSSLFAWPFGFLFRYWGGIPVERSKKSNLVAQVVEQYKQRERMHLVISPEGTRKKVDKLKTGFYHIALGAGVPICLCQFNWKTKEVFFDPELFYPTGDEKADLAYIWDYFSKVPAYNPEQSLEKRSV
jgi:1-acyl-sn-glycerol-3-phosphate acyltransferase